MRAKFVELAQQAGFLLWQDEAHRPQTEIIDWSCGYDRELEQFAILIIQQCARQAGVSPTPQGDYYKGRRDARDLILEYFEEPKT